MMEKLVAVLQNNNTLVDSGTQAHTILEDVEAEASQLNHIKSTNLKSLCT